MQTTTKTTKKYKNYKVGEHYDYDRIRKHLKNDTYVLLSGGMGTTKFNCNDSYRR
jgi:hypothetical protein